MAYEVLRENFLLSEHWECLNGHDRWTHHDVPTPAVRKRHEMSYCHQEVRACVHCGQVIGQERSHKTRYCSVACRTANRSVVARQRRLVTA